MDLSKLRYSKREAEKDTSAMPRRSQPANENVNASFSEGLALSAGYAKEQPTVETQIVFIISGGAKREKDYFKQIIKDRKIKRLKIAFTSKDGQGLVPQQMNDLAKEFIQQKRFRTGTDSYSIDTHDTLFMLQDVDEFETDIKRIFKDEHIMQTEWIISNPSFEIWLFYHKFDTPKGILDEGINKPLSERSQWLKRKLDDIVPGGINPVTILANVRTAIENSKKNYSEIDGLPALYSTKMHILAERVLAVLGDEFDNMLKRREERLKEFLERRYSKE